MANVKLVDLNSKNVMEEFKTELKDKFPQVFNEDKIDCEKLKLALGETIDTGRERFGMNWPGKANAIRVAQEPSGATLKPDRASSVDFDTTENLYLEGDNLEILKLLQRSYFGKIKMIYIDPPYNTGKEFIYPDKYAEGLETYLQYTGQIDAQGKKFTTNVETDGRYHSKWMNMMWPRLMLARNLLADDGVIFISIDDHEVDNLKKICNEIFGEENFAAMFPWKKRTAKSDVPFGVSQDYEWILCYAKDRFIAGLEQERKYYQTNDFPNDRWRLSDLTSQRSAEERPNSAFNLVDPKTKKVYPFNPQRTWAVTKDTFHEYYDKGKIVFPDEYDFLKIKIPAYRVFESEDKAKALKKYGSEDAIRAISTFLPKEVGMSEDGNKEIVELFGRKIFSFPKPTTLIKYIISLINKNDYIVLDFFSGSATTAHAVMQLNAKDGGGRKFIMTQLQEVVDETTDAGKVGYKNICEIGKERIRRAAKKIREVHEGKQAERKSAIDLGFKVYKLDKSNFSAWDGKETENLFAKLKEHVNHVGTESKDEDILYELLLKSGYELTAKVEEVKIGNRKIYVISGGELVVCLEKDIDNDLTRTIADKKPTRVICLNKGFKQDADLTNTAQIFKSKEIEFMTV